MRRGLVAGFIVLASLVAGCRIEPDGPTLRITSASANWIYLSWLPPSRGDYSGYAVESRVGDGEFQVLADVGQTTSFSTQISSVPEATDVSFRVRALPDDGGTRTSNVVTYRRPLASAPTIVCASVPCAPMGGVVSLSFGAPSSSYSLLLERRSIDCTGASSAWTALPLAPGATGYADSDVAQWTDGAVLEYRLTKVSGTEQSPPALARTAAAPPARLATFTAEATTAGTRITLQNGSQCAVTAVVHSHPDDRLVQTVTLAAGLGGTATLNLTGVDAGRDLYSAALSSGFTSPPALAPRAWALGPGASTPDWNASLIDVGPGTRAARLPSGAVATADSAAVYAPGAAGPDPLEFSGTFCGVRADPSGRVHALFNRAAPAGTELVHAEHDGSTWTEEVVATGISTSAACVLEVALDGTLLAAWDVGWIPQVASRGSVSWQIDTLMQDAAVIEFFLAGDEAGRPHLLAALGSGGLQHWYIGTSGWEQEPLDVAYWEVEGFAATPGALAFVFDVMSSVPNLPPEIMERTSLGWGAPVALSGTLPTSAMRVAGSRSGYRLAVSWPGGIVWLRDGSGTSVRSWPRIGDYELGFGPDGKAWILENLHSYSSGGVVEPAVLFEEP